MVLDNRNPDEGVARMNSVQADEQAVHAIYHHAASLVRDGKSKPQVRDDLISRGMGEPTADLVTNKIFELRARARREAGGSAMLQGALWCVGGLLVTGVTFAMASGGGIYVVAYGAVIFGAVQFLKGVAYMSGL
jgi:hypothetical protein